MPRHAPWLFCGFLAILIWLEYGTTPLGWNASVVPSVALSSRAAYSQPLLGSHPVLHRNPKEPRQIALFDEGDKFSFIGSVDPQLQPFGQVSIRKQVVQLVADWPTTDAPNETVRHMKTLQILVNDNVDSLNATDLIRILQCLSELSERDPGVWASRSPFQQIVEDLASRVQVPAVYESLSPSELAELGLTLSHLGQAEASLLQYMCARLAENMVVVDPRSVSKAVLAVAHLRFNSSVLLTAVAARVKASAPDFQPRQLLHLLAAFAELRFVDLGMLRCIADQLLEIASTLKAREIVQILMAYATLSVKHDDLCESLSARLLETDVLQTLRGPSLGQLAWALGTLLYRNERLMAAVARRARDPQLLAGASPKDLAELMWGFAVLGVKDEPLIAAVAEHSLARRLTYRARPLATMLWALAKQQARHPAFVRLLTDAAIRSSVPFHHTGLCNVAWAAGVLQIDDPDFLRGLANRAVTIPNGTPRMKFRTISTVLWAYTAVNVRHPDVFDSLGQRLVTERLLDGITPYKVGQTAWSFATLGHLHVPLMDALTARFNAWKHPLPPLYVARMFSAYAALGLCDPDLFAKWGAILKEAKTLEPRWLVLVAQAFGTCGMRDSPLLPWLLEAFRRPEAVQTLSGHEVAALMGALVSAGVQDKRLFASLASILATDRLLWSLDVADIAKACFSLTTVSSPHETLMQGFLKRLRDPHFLATGDPSDLACIVAAYAAVPMQDRKFLLALAQRLMEPGVLPTLNAWSMSTVARSYAALGCKHHGLLAAIARHALRRLEDFTAQGLATLLLAFAELGFWNGRLTLGMVQAKVLATPDPHALTNMLWALTVFNVVDDAVFAALLRQVQGLEVQREGLCQLHQVLLHVRLHAAQMPLARGCVQKEFAQRAEAAFRVPERTSSALQRDVAGELRGLGAWVREEVVLPPAGGGYSVDIYCPRQGLVVEVDGPAHFFWNGTDFQPCASTILKRRQLAALGYLVVSVPFHAYKHLSSDAKRVYLRDHLLEAVNGRGGPPPQPRYLSQFPLTHSPLTARSPSPSHYKATSWPHS